jgi:tetratricopeptide (TPR) repeat protein
MKRSVCITLLACLACPTASLADDASARAKLQEAFTHWEDENPRQLLRLIKEAEAEKPTDPFLYNQILVSKASVYHVKTGDLEKAEQLYSEVIRNLAGVEELPLRQIKAEAMVRKGNLIYSEKDDVKGAMQLFVAAHQTFTQSTTADVASQLSLRLAYDKQTGPTKRQQLFEQALKLADESIASVGDQFVEGSTRDQQLAKFQLQRVLVLHLSGLEEDAVEQFEAINKDNLVEMAWYQLSVYHVLKGEVDEGTQLLTNWLATRKTTRTRNQARKFIRNEPHFADLLEREDWADLVTEEKDDRRPGVRTGPARSRPSGS